MSAPTAPRGARQVAWSRRAQRASEGWREFRRNRAGLFGLIVLIIVILIAVGAPVIAPSSGLDVTQVTAGKNQPPSIANPLVLQPQLG